MIWEWFGTVNLFASWFSFVCWTRFHCVLCFVLWPNQSKNLPLPTNTAVFFNLVICFLHQSIWIYARDMDVQLGITLWSIYELCQYFAWQLLSSALRVLLFEQISLHRLLLEGKNPTRSSLVANLRLKEYREPCSLCRSETQCVKNIMQVKCFCRSFCKPMYSIFSHQLLLG